MKYIIAALLLVCSSVSAESIFQDHFEERIKMQDFIAVAHDTAPYMTLIRKSTWSEIPMDFGLSAPGLAVAYDPNNNWLVFAGNTTSNDVYVFDTTDWSKTSVRAGTASGYARNIAFNSTGSLLAVFYSSANVIVYDTSNWSVVTTLSVGSMYGHAGLAFSNDDSMLAIPHQDDDASNHALSVFDTSTWAKITSFGSPIHYGKVAWSPDDTYLAALGSALTVYDTATWTFLDIYHAEPTSLEFISNNQILGPRYNDLIFLEIDINNDLVEYKDRVDTTPIGVSAWGHDIALDPGNNYAVISFNNEYTLSAVDLSDDSLITISSGITTVEYAKSVVFGSGQFPTNLLMGQFP